MQLIKDIIDLAVNSGSPISDLLRKCLVLAYELDNDKLKNWVEKELDGYQFEDELPDYRNVRVVARGLFLGPFNAQLRNQPLAAHILDEKHRHWAEMAELRQPVVAYEKVDDPKVKKISTPAIDWPATLTTYYQTKFIRGYVLNRAWQEIPRSSIVSLVDTVRNRTLRFALEMQNQLGRSNDDLSKVAAEKVDQIVTNNIYGGTVFIAAHAHDITQIGVIKIGKDDAVALTSALSKIGIQQTDIDRLMHALEQDKSDPKAPHGLGQRTTGWIKKAASGGLKAGVEIGKPLLTSWLQQYLGLA